MKMTASETLARFRRAAGWSRRELSRISGVNSAGIYKIENECRGIGPLNAARLAKAFRVPVKTFLPPAAPGSNMKTVRRRNGKTYRRASTKLLALCDACQTPMDMLWPCFVCGSNLCAPCAQKGDFKNHTCAVCLSLGEKWRKKT